VEDEDAQNLPAAYNASIYLMLAAGYGSFFVLGFLVYRGVKKNAAYLRACGRASEPGEPFRVAPQPVGEHGP
jgi:hypothetical protein